MSVKVFSWAVAFAWVWIATPAWAHSPQSLEQAFAQAFSQASELAPLKDAGFSPGVVLVVERLPNGLYAVEFELKHAKAASRWVVVVRQQGELGDHDHRWTITWMPAVTYASAFANMARSGQLAKVESAPWTQAPRLPAMPIVVTRKTIVTPFGQVDLSQIQALEGGDLALIEPLAEHVQRWLATLAQDPAVAGVDIIADGALSWRGLNSVVLTVAMQGLYSINMVVDSARGLGAIPLIAPAMKLPKLVVVVGMYQRDGPSGFRIDFGDEHYRPNRASACPAQMSICAATPAELQRELKEMATHPFWGDVRAQYLILAATGDLAVKTVLANLTLVAPTLGLKPKATFMGYIQ